MLDESTVSSRIGIDHIAFFKELGRRIRELRLKNGYTQAHMARLEF